MTAPANAGRFPVLNTPRRPWPTMPADQPVNSPYRPRRDRDRTARSAS